MKPFLLLVAAAGGLLFLLRKQKDAAPSADEATKAAEALKNLGPFSSSFTDARTFNAAEPTEVIASWYAGDGKVAQVTRDGSVYLRKSGEAGGEVYIPPFKPNA